MQDFPAIGIVAKIIGLAHDESEDGAEDEQARNEPPARHGRIDGVALATAAQAGCIGRVGPLVGDAEEMILVLMAGLRAAGRIQLEATGDGPATRC